MPVPLALRKEVFGKFLRLRTAITKAVQYRIGQDVDLDKKVEHLRGDIRNAPSHVFGEHEKCGEIQYFNCQKKNESNLVPAMKECGLYADILIALQRLVDNSNSLILNMDNNLAEHYNSVVCKFVGGKRVNFCLKGSYQTRCEAAALSFNAKGDYFSVISRTAVGKSPQCFTKKYAMRRNKILSLRKKLFVKKKTKPKKQTLPDKDYGPNANYIPLDVESPIYINKAREFLNDLKKSTEEILEIQNDTVGQSSNPRWVQERSLRITASNFGKICKMRPKTSPINSVKYLLYGNFTGNRATKYGQESECRAIADFEARYDLNVTQCGLYIDEDNYYLGASPDGIVVGADAIIEIKCPFVISKISPEKGILEKKITFAVIKNNGLYLKRNHNYYYQVQGQLSITQKKFCYFVIWSPFGIMVEKITRDEEFWKENVPKLKHFYENFLLPELVDPLYPKGLPIRDKAVNLESPLL